MLKPLKNTSTIMWIWTNIFGYEGNSAVWKSWELLLKTSLKELTFGMSENEDWGRGHWLLRETQTRRSVEPKAKIQICCCSFTKLCPALLWSHGLLPARLLCLWDLPGKNSGVGFHCLLQEIFSTQGLNPHLLPWQVDSLPLSTREALRQIQPTKT